MAKKSFDQWLKEVDAAIKAKFMGLGMLDLPDCPYADWYEDGVTPKGAASRAIKRAKE